MFPRFPGIPIEGAQLGTNRHMPGGQLIMILCSPQHGASATLSSVSSRRVAGDHTESVTDAVGATHQYRSVPSLGAASRRAKIVCTIGPVTATSEKIRELVRAGMDVARLNFSHGTHADHARVCS